MIMEKPGIRSCWCGNNKPDDFSNQYSLCNGCSTLISKIGLSKEELEVSNDNDDSSFYGKNYWLSHQTKNLGMPDIHERTRSDLSERCLYWLSFLLKYKIPSAKILELGSMHGGFIALLRQAGYDATGLDLSPSIVAYAKEIFDIPMLVGCVEEQQIPTSSLDAIVLMDVLEHLPTPVSTMQHCLKLLKPDGVLIIQTPRYTEGKYFTDMLAEKSRFPEMLKADEHLYLFSASAVQKLFRQLGANYIKFEPAIFSHYDMFFVISRSPIVCYNPEEIAASLTSTPQGRLIQAMLDLYDKCESITRLYNEAEIDRANRLKAINDLTKLYHASESYQTIQYRIVLKMKKIFRIILSRLKKGAL